MTRPRLAITVQKASKLRPLPSAADIRRWVAAAGSNARGEITVRIVDERESAKLNERYRGKAGATNVLAFQAGPVPERPSGQSFELPAGRAPELSVVPVSELPAVPVPEWAADAEGGFPPVGELETALEAELDDSLSPLGDLVVCAPVIEREAQQQAKTSSAHWAHIVMHGTLHLLGYDHETDSAARAMEDRERELLAGFGFGDPYSVDSQ